MIEYESHETSLSEEYYQNHILFVCWKFNVVYILYRTTYTLMTLEKGLLKTLSETEKILVTRVIFFPILKSVVYIVKDNF